MEASIKGLGKTIKWKDMGFLRMCRHKVCIKEGGKKIKDMEKGY